MLYLFSSNAQPQYAQDVLNVVAAPAGYKARFRYDRDYVSATAQAGWGKSLIGSEVLVHFALQQQHKYFTPVLFPVRRGRVVDAWCDGSIHLVDFEVTDTVSLVAPDTATSHPQFTKNYRERLEAQGVPLPYEAHASVSEYDAVADNASSRLLRVDQPPPNAHEQSELFRITADYLSHTETYSTALFALVSRMRKVGADVVVEIDAGNHAYHLTAGEEYELEFLQAQPSAVTAPAIIDVVLDGVALQAIGPAQLTISSKYDVQSVRIYVCPIDEPLKHSTIGVRPAGGVMGPVLDIPVEIRPNTAKELGAAAITAASAIALGLATIFTKLSVWPKLGLVVLATLFAGGMKALRLSTKSL